MRKIQFRTVLLSLMLLAYFPLMSQSLSVSSTVSNASCEGVCDGEISVSASGGGGTYSYLWSTGSTGNLLENACAGNYSLTVIDGNAQPFDWSYSVSSDNMSIIITGGSVLVDGQAVSPNDTIGVFAIKNGNEYCGHYRAVNPTQNFSMAAMASDNFSQVIQFDHGDELHFKLYRASDGQVIGCSTFLSYHPAWEH